MDQEITDLINHLHDLREEWHEIEDEHRLVLNAYISNVSRIFYFGIPRALSELLLPSAKNLPRKAELVRQVSRYL